VDALDGRYPNNRGCVHARLFAILVGYPGSPDRPSSAYAILAFACVGIQAFRNTADFSREDRRQKPPHSADIHFSCAILPASQDRISDGCDDLLAASGSNEIMHQWSENMKQDTSGEREALGRIGAPSHRTTEKTVTQRFVVVQLLEIDVHQARAKFALPTMEDMVEIGRHRQ